MQGPQATAPGPQGRERVGLLGRGSKVLGRQSEPPPHHL